MNNTVNLLFGTSIYDLKQAQMPSAQSLTVREGLRLYSPGAALVKVPESFFNRHPVEAQVALASVRDAPEVFCALYRLRGLKNVINMDGVERHAEAFTWEKVLGDYATLLLDWA